MMKKAAAKNKGAQGCMKISSFFSKQTDTKKSANPKENVKRIPESTVIAQEIISLESEDEESPSLMNFQPKHVQSKRKLEHDSKTNLSPPLKRTTISGMAKVQNSSPQPSTSGVTPSNISNEIDVLREPPHMVPSTSGESPGRNKATFGVKSVDKLLNPAALKEFNSPEKIMERFLDKTTRQVTPVKLSFRDRTPEKNEINSTSTEARNGTPKSRIRTPSKNSGKKSSGEKSADNTPSKQRRTPKKLFDRSPTNLNEFNVEVLRNFVKITPSKKEVERQEDEIDCPRRSLDVQLQNEKTPVKNQGPGCFSPELKVRTKLDFSKCGVPAKNGEHASQEKRSIKNFPDGIGTITVDDDEASGSSVKGPRTSSFDKENLDLNNLNLNFEEDWDTEFIMETDYSLDLTKSQHCKLVDVSHRTAEIIVTMKSTRTNQQAICALQGFWIHSKLCIGDTVHVEAAKLQDNTWLVDNQNGFLVFEPDLLLSVTSVVGSVFCKRKQFLQEKYRGFEGTNRFMIVGQMVHTLLQEVLKKKLNQYTDIDRCAKEILKRKELIRQVYESGESLVTIQQEFMLYVPKIHEFVRIYVQNDMKKANPRPYNKDDWQGAISGIDEIEENIWCPDLGIKGKVDVSIKNGLETIPLEVKTGRASVSLQHRGQVLLYIMMMNKLGYRVSTGLLLYLKSLDWSIDSDS